MCMLRGMGGRTLVQGVLVLLALGAAADHAVELVHYAAAAVAGGGLGVGVHGVDGRVLLGVGELVDEIHLGGGGGGVFGWVLGVGCVGVQVLVRLR